MWLTQNQCLIPKQLMHNYTIKRDNEETLKDIMLFYCIPIPHEWNNQQNMSIFDQAYFGIIPDINGHQSDEQNEQGFTVAMILAYNNIYIPTQWQHVPTLRNNYSYTVAMILAMINAEIPKQWHHDPSITNISNQNVASILAEKIFCHQKNGNIKYRIIRFNMIQNIFYLIMDIQEPIIIQYVQIIFKQKLQMTNVRYAQLKENNNLSKQFVDIKYVLNAYNSYVKMIKVVNVQYVDKKIGFNFNKIKMNNNNDYLLF